MTNQSPNLPSIRDHLLNLLGPNGENWIQSNPLNQLDKSKTCLGLALTDALARMSYEYPLDPGLHTAIQEGLQGMPAATLPQFNDNPSTTWPDILKLINSIDKEVNAYLLARSPQ